MIKFNIIDNLESHDRDLTDEEAEKISELIRINIKESNKGEYSEEDIDFLINIRSAELIKKRAGEGFLVFLTNESKDVIGCGIIVKRDDKYKLRMLHVKEDYRGRGFGKKICDIREDKLRKMRVKEVYIESLKFKDTLRFHKKRGFEEVNDNKFRKFTILMKKRLSCFFKHELY